ncbi:MlaD family protein [Rhodococcoides navarretei]|uniref:MlaD family protein n=1 Tax=Rhodococcus navarretei TaxID=3128981 RepID=A0ABU9D1E6_9NOCA
MSTRRMVVHMALFLAIALGCAGYIVDATGGLRVLGKDRTFSVEVADAGGLAVRSEVDYRGVPIGQVTSVVPDPGGQLVRIEVSAAPDTRIPAAATAAVGQDTAAPVLKLRLFSESHTAPFLPDGGVIPISQTGTPVAISSVLSRLVTLVDSVNPTDLDTLTQELGIARPGRSSDLGELLDSIDDLTDTIAPRADAIGDIADDASALLVDSNDGPAAIPDIISAARTLTALAADNDTQIRASLITIPDTLLDRLLPLVDENSVGVAALLTSAVGPAQVVGARTDAIDRFLTTVPDGLAKLASPVKNNRLQVDLVPNIGVPCFYDTVRRTPYETAPTPFDRDLRCVAPGGLPPKGADSAPRISGDLADLYANGAG